MPCCVRTSYRPLFSIWHQGTRDWTDTTCLDHHVSQKPTTNLLTCTVYLHILAKVLAFICSLSPFPFLLGPTNWPQGHWTVKSNYMQLSSVSHTKIKDLGLTEGRETIEKEVVFSMGYAALAKKTALWPLWRGSWRKSVCGLPAWWVTGIHNISFQPCFFLSTIVKQVVGLICSLVTT